MLPRHLRLLLLQHVGQPQEGIQRALRLLLARSALQRICGCDGCRCGLCRGGGTAPGGGGGSSGLLGCNLRHRLSSEGPQVAWRRP